MNSKKILLAEDDMDDQQLFRDFLQHRSDIVILPMAENGEALIEALDKMKGEVPLPDMIVLDQNMPKKNGLQTLKFLKACERLSHIPVMIYSTYTDEFLIKTASEMGAISVMPKPVSKEGYNKMIDAFLQVVA